jgi:hypothetical protein
MKKNIFIFLSVLLLSGCATYKFQRGGSPYDKGYVVTHDGDTIVQYTVGKDNSVPDDLNLARERFKRRRGTVEYYYKRMGQIQSVAMRYLAYPAVIVDFAKGELSLPFVWMRNRKYERDPQYRAKVDKEEQEKDAIEEARIKKLNDELNEYIQKDIESEGPVVIQQQVALAKKETQAEKITSEKEMQPEKPIAAMNETQVTQVEQQAATEQKGPEIVQPPLEQKAQEVKQAPIEKQEVKLAEEKKEVKIKKEARQALSDKIEAVITAKPLRGLAPLVVHFYGGKSYSRSAKITSYSWDFGDGDTSSKENPVNTYYSVSFEPRNFTATLTVTDAKGNTATSSVIITVQNK